MNNSNATQRVNYLLAANRDDAPEALGRNGWMATGALSIFPWHTKKVV